MEIHRISRLLLLATATLLVPASALAAEKIQITGSTSVQVPKPNQVLEDSRKSRNFDGPSGRSTYEGSMYNQGPVLLPTNPQADKKFKDAIDRKKNWIFVNPYESQYDTKTQEFLQGEKGTALYNHPLMQGEDKGVVQRFIEEKRQDRELENEGSEPTGRSDHDRYQESDPTDFRGNTGTDPFTGDKDPNGNLNRGLVLSSPLQQRSALMQERDAFQERMERDPLSASIFGRSEPKERTTFTKEERAARDAELNKIYQPRIAGVESPLGSGARGIDPLNTFDATRQEATPFSGRRTDQLFNAGRPDSSSLGAGRNSPIFTGPSIGAPGSGLNSRMAERSGFDINARAPSASSFSPNISSSPASAPTFMKPAPFVLPLPQRKF